MTGSFLSYVPMCKAVEFRIDKGHQLIARILIAIAPSDKQLRYVIRQ